MNDSRTPYLLSVICGGGSIERRAPNRSCREIGVWGVGGNQMVEYATTLLTMETKIIQKKT